jgi:hypothetical protein
MAESSTNEKRSFNFLLWIPLGFLAVCIFLFVVVAVTDRRYWPPPWLERRAQREFVFTNVVAAGGWSAFSAECDSLISQSRISGQNQWFMPFGKFPDSLIGNKFPASYKIISRLKPIEVDVVALDNKPAYVSIQVFGLHRTGGHDTPMYLLVYQQAANSDQCVAANLFNVIKLKPMKITDSVFEIY